MISDCVFRRTRNTILVSSALSAPHIKDPVRLMCTLTATQPYQSTHLQSIQLVPFRAIQPLPPQSVCNYCQKLDHAHRNCRMANGLCLAYGSSDHSLGECPHRRTRNNTPALTVFPTPPVRGNPGPVVIRAPLPPQQQAFYQAQRGAMFSADRGKGQVHE